MARVWDVGRRNAGKIQSEQTGKVESTAISKLDGFVCAAVYNGSDKSIIYALLDGKLHLKHLYTQTVEETGTCAHSLSLFKKKGHYFVLSLRFKNRVDLLIVGNNHLHAVECSKWVGGGDEGSHHGMVWSKPNDEVLIFAEKSIRAIRIL